MQNSGIYPDRSDTEAAKKEQEKLGIAVNKKTTGSRMNVDIDSSKEHCAILISLEQVGNIKAALVKTKNDEWLIERYHFEEPAAQ